MELEKNEIIELQEKLILVYRFISQKKMFIKFFCEGLEVKQNFKDESGLITKLMEMEDGENLLKNCIIELESMKENINEYNSFDPQEFHEFIIYQDYNYLYKKYGLKNLDDVDKLDLRTLLDHL